MSKNKEIFEPVWTTQICNEKCVRTIIKHGVDDVFQAPNQRVFGVVKSLLSLCDDDFQNMKNTGLEEFSQTLDVSSKIDLSTLENIGCEICTDSFERVKASFDNSQRQIAKFRNGIFENIVDVIAYPKTEAEIVAILQFAKENDVNIVVDCKSEKVISPCVKIDLSKHFARVLEFNEMNLTITVQSGLSLLQIEYIVNDAPKNFGVSRRYTLDIDDVDMSCLAYKNGKCNQSVAYKDISIETSTTLHIKRKEERCKKFAYLFACKDDALTFVRETVQSGCGSPQKIHLADEKETDILIDIYGCKRIADILFAPRGYCKDGRCLVYGSLDGELGYQNNMIKNMRRLSKRSGGWNLTGIVANILCEDDSIYGYLQESLQDYGIVRDSVKCLISWDSVLSKMQEVDDCLSQQNCVFVSHIANCDAHNVQLETVFAMKADDINDFENLIDIANSLV